MYNVQYEKRFFNELVAAPKFMQDDFVEMVLDLQIVPRQGDRYQVEPSIERPNAYHMLFDEVLAWVSYTVEDGPPPIVSVYRLINTRDLL